MTPLSNAAPESENSTIPDRIFSLIKEAIVEGEMAAGSKISEPELARAYGISRGPLREAIGRLEACGLVVRRPNVGARVVTLSNRQLIEIFHVREALEGMSARLAANSRQAWTSSASRSGKSVNISVEVTPSASISRMSATRMRIPRIQGRPPHCPGLVVMRASSRRLSKMWELQKR